MYIAPPLPVFSYLELWLDTMVAPKGATMQQRSVTQMWARPDEMAVSVADSSRGQARDPLFRPYRVAAECSAVLLVASWLIGINVWMSMPSRCTTISSAPHTLAQTVGRAQVTIVVASSRKVWSVNPKEGMLRIAEPAQRGSALRRDEQSFQVEWQSSTYFCLRWLGNMRLVEVVLPPQPDARTLIVGPRFGCDHPSQHFRVSGNSLFSLGAGSFVNVREGWHLRAHGDRGDGPLPAETPRTRVYLEEADAMSDEIERRLLAMLAQALDPQRPSNATAAVR